MKQKRKTEPRKARPLTPKDLAEFREALTDYRVVTKPKDNFEQRRVKACDQ